MEFGFGQYTIRATLEKPETFDSPHTGKNLQRGEISLRTNAQELVEALRPGVVLTGNGSGRQWRIARRTYSSTSSQSEVTTLGFELEEMENREASAIEFGGLTLTPERYSESADGEGLLKVKARVAARGDELATLRRVLFTHDEIDLVRKGVSDRPRRVSIEALVWSRANDTAETVFDLEFVERSKRERVPVGSFFADWHHVRMTSAYAFAGMKEIIRTLAEKGRTHARQSAA
jgi:hypothetical protein